MAWNLFRGYYFSGSFIEAEILGFLLVGKFEEMFDITHKRNSISLA